MSIDEPHDIAAETETQPASAPAEAVAPALVQPEPVAPDPDPTPAAPSNRGLKLAVVALAALSFALAIVAAMVSASSKDDGRDAAVRRAAGAFGTALLTYSPKTTAQWRQNVSRLSAGSFKKDFDKNGRALAAVFEYTGNTVRALDAEVFLGDVHSKTAVAFVIVDAASGSKDKSPVALQGFLRLDLLNDDGTWLVYEVTNYNDAGLPTQASASTTSTTAAAGR